VIRVVLPYHLRNLAHVGSEVAIDRNYANRNGYALGFLGDSVPLPDVSVAAAAFGRASINRDTGESVLPYTHYSVIMNAERRLAYVSAVNIDGKLWRQIVRGQDAWTYDPRIPNAEQSGAVHDPESAYTEYPDPKRSEWVTKILPAIKDITLAELIRLCLRGQGER